MNKNHLFPVIIGVTFVLIAVLAWTLFLAPVDNSNTNTGYQSGELADNSPQATLTVPDQILGANKMQEQSGPSAIEAITQMHKTEIDVLNAYIITYAKSDAQITLWLSISPNEEEAEYLFRVMDEKVPDSQVFTGREPITLGGRDVIKVNGMGQEHFYWQEGTINYWVAIQGNGDRDALVKEVVDKVR